MYSVRFRCTTFVWSSVSKKLSFNLGWIRFSWSGCSTLVFCCPRWILFQFLSRPYWCSFCDAAVARVNSFGKSFAWGETDLFSAMLTASGTSMDMKRSKSISSSEMLRFFHLLKHLVELHHSAFCYHLSSKENRHPLFSYSKLLTSNAWSVSAHNNSPSNT